MHDEDHSDVSQPEAPQQRPVLSFEGNKAVLRIGGVVIRDPDQIEKIIRPVSLRAKSAAANGPGG